MSLSSVLQTAHSGMSAAIASVDAVSHNIANSRTNAYKAVRPVFATQPSWSRGPLEIGMGVQVTGFVTDNSLGPLIADSSGGVTELSNTDVGEELVELILAEEQFLASANVFETADDLLNELIHLGRRDD